MELNIIQNLRILSEELRSSIQFLETKQHKIIKNTARKELDDLDQQIKYLHKYLQEVGQVLRDNNLSVPYWHEVKTKVDGHD